MTLTGAVSHDQAVTKAELEYDRFAASRAGLPAPVEQHFEEAVRDVKQIEKGRRPTPPLTSETKSKRRP